MKKGQGMQGDGFPITRDLVLVGGGHAHALVLRMWGMNPLPGVRVTVVNPGPVAPYTGMLPGHIAGHYARDDLMIDLVRLARFAGARVVLDRVVGFDRAKGQVLLQGRGPLRYDVASVDVGIGSGLPDVPGFAEFAQAAKPLGDYATRWDAFVARRLAFPRVVVVGAGVGGAELALASMHRLRAAGGKPQVTLIDRGEGGPKGLSDKTRRAVLAELAAAGVEVLTHATPARITADAVELADGRRIGSDFTLSVTGAIGQGWLADTGLELTDGHIRVGPTLQSSDPAIFAAGDCAHLSHAPRPKAGVYAVRAAPVLLHNLRAALSGGAMRAFHPQRDYLKLISLGDQRAIADRSGLRAAGGWLWRWKDRIDCKFMAKFADYPVMAVPAVPVPAALGLAQAMAEKPLCGGCGAKLGPGVLAAALSDMPAMQRGDVLSGPGDDAAVLRAGRGVQVMTTDHLRAMLCDPGLVARIAAVHALGDVWAMGAAPQAVLAQITLPKASPGIHADMLREIMAAASDVVQAAGADIVGGHTSIGAELTIGFTVTGLAERAVGKGGAQPGDVLILTKALGTGTILAAEMALAAPTDTLMGEALVGALASMTQPLGPAAAILAPHAHAMTDVTGFGLAGHLLEMMEASGTAAEVDLAAIPFLPGAEELAGMGHASGIAPDNLAAVSWRMEAPQGARTDLLVDPQTGGGLLAAVPADQAEALLAALSKPAAIIGRVVAGSPYLWVREG